MSVAVKHFIARDSKPVFYRQWQGDTDKPVLVYLHGIESHSEWFIDTANDLNARGLSVYAMERRGSGVNKSDRGHMDSYHVLVDDLREAVELIRTENPGQKIYLIGLCWGGKLAVTFASDHQELIDGLILISPAIKTQVDLSLPQKLNVLFSTFLMPKKLITIPIEPEMFTKNPKYLEFIKNDTHRLTRATARFFFETNKMDTRVSKTSSKIKVPVALFMAGDDRVVDNGGVKKWFDKCGSGGKTLKLYQGSCHSLEFEEEAKGLVGDITNWINERKS